MPVRPAATASFESALVFEGQPLRGFTSDVFVALPGSSGGENKRDELVSWCGPRSPLLGEQAALPGSTPLWRCSPVSVGGEVPGQVLHGL